MANTEKETKATKATGDAAAQAEKLLADAKEQAAKELEAANAAKAEAEKLLAEAKAKNEEASKAQETKATKPAPAANPADPGEELVEVQLFKDNGKYKDDVFVAVNGERVQIKRGERVQIKRKFAEVLQQSMEQDTATANMIERQSADYEAKATALGV